MLDQCVHFQQRKEILLFYGVLGMLQIAAGVTLELRWGVVLLALPAVEARKCKARQQQQAGQGFQGWC